MTLPERRSKLPNFWYMLANESSCLRARFLDYFNEPQEFRIHIRKDRCCSNCNPDFQLGKLDNHYMYCERGNSLNVKRKKVLEMITTWTEDQIPAVFPNPSFQPTVYCFISADQLTQLAKDAHIITNLDTLRKALISWRFFQSHGVELLTKLREAHCTAEATSQASRKAGSQTQASSQSGQGSSIWATITTSVSTSLSTLSQTMPVSTQPVILTHRLPGGIPGDTLSANRKRSE